MEKRISDAIGALSIAVEGNSWEHLKILIGNISELERLLSAEQNKLIDSECHVEELERQRDALLSENFEAKKVISECREYFIAGVMNRIRPTNEAYLHMICDIHGRVG